MIITVFSSVEAEIFTSSVLTAIFSTSIAVGISELVSGAFIIGGDESGWVGSILFSDDWTDFFLIFI